MEVLYTTMEAARDTLALIRYKVEGNDEKFKETALAISRKLDSEGRCDAALFIRAQYNEIPTFIPMGISYVRPSKDAYYLGIAKAVAQRATCLRRIYGANGTAAIPENVTAVCIKYRTVRWWSVVV